MYTLSKQQTSYSHQISGDFYRMGYGPSHHGTILNKSRNEYLFIFAILLWNAVYQPINGIISSNQVDMDITKTFKYRNCHSKPKVLT